MTFSSIVESANIRPSSQRSSRGGAKIDHFILHHSAAFDVNQVLQEMITGSRQVSANYVVANDGTAYGVVDEEDRAWTSGSTTDGGKGAAWDKRSITFEILDMTGAPDWLISEAAMKTVAAIVADCSHRYGITPQRAGGNTGWTVYGHRELYQIFGASYATACPGGLDLDHVVALATAPTQKETDMLVFVKRTSAGSDPWYVTDGITRRALTSPDITILNQLGIMSNPNNKPNGLAVIGDLIDKFVDVTDGIPTTVDPKALAAALAPLLNEGDVTADDLSKLETALTTAIDAVPGLTATKTIQGIGGALSNG